MTKPYEYDPRPQHHIRSTEEMYNELSDHIVLEFLRAYPKARTDYETVYSMVSKLANDSILRQAREEEIADNLNKSIANNMSTISSLFRALDKGSIEVHPQGSEAADLDTE